MAVFVTLAVAVNIPGNPVVRADERLALAIAHRRPDFAANVASVIVAIGHLWVIVPLTLVASLIVGRLTRSAWRGIAVTSVPMICGIVSVVLKMILPSRHHDLGLGSVWLTQPGMSHTFPSSHMAVALGLGFATTFALFTSHRGRIAGLLAGSIVGIVLAMALIVGHYHWTSDVVGGACLATATAWAMRPTLRGRGPHRGWRHP